MEQRVSLITLGVADVARSRSFYEALGWRAAAASSGEVAFFQLGGLVLACFGAAALAADAGVRIPAPGAEESPGFRGSALAYNTRAQEEVEVALCEAEAAGGRLVKPAGPTFWGGYAGYFADPDGHLWEVAFNPFASLDETGAFRIDGQAT